MNAEEFRKAGKEMVDLMADYMENIRDRRPLSNVEPGYLSKLIPGQAPEEGEKWEDVVSDVERVVMPGVTHWHSPQFHAYFPTGNSYPAILGDMLSDIIGCIGFTWSSSPACTELEIVMMDWLGKMLQLPEEFLSGGQGGGIIQGTASEATLVGLLAARNKAIAEARAADADADVGILLSKLVVYGSDQAHSSVERAAMLGAVKYHVVESDDNHAMRGDALSKAIAEDRTKGLKPFYVVATLGTTPSCAFDNLLEIGPVCREENVWLHIDAAYAGSAFICPEFRPLLDGVELADSFNFNPHKWLLVNFDCSTMWFKDVTHVVDAYNVDPVYLRHKHQGKMPDFRHWQIPLGRRFRSLKLWFVVRLFGVKGLQQHIRRHVALAHRFESLVTGDPRFVVTNEVKLGLVCFKLKGSNDLNKTLLHNITEDGRIHLVASESRRVYFLRFAVCSSKTNDSDIDLAWTVVDEVANKLLCKQANGVSTDTA